jgi:hypothetical protein
MWWIGAAGGPPVRRRGIGLETLWEQRVDGKILLYDVGCFKAEKQTKNRQTICAI